MKESGKKTKPQARANSGTQMAISTKVNGMMTKLMGMAPISMSMELATLECGKTTCKMEKALKVGQMGHIILEITEKA